MTRDDFTPYAKSIEGKRIYAYANDHPPPHAHVRLDDGRDGTVLFHLVGGDPLPHRAYSRRALRAWNALRPAVVPYLPELHAAFDRLNSHR